MLHVVVFYGHFKYVIINITRHSYTQCLLLVVTIRCYVLF